jgi:hypothetical protein
MERLLMPGKITGWPAETLIIGPSVTPKKRI